MSRLRRELAVIPTTGWLITVGVVGVLAATIVLAPDDPGPAERVMIAAVVSLVLLTYGLLLSYVYADARRRGMRHVLWTLVAAFVPNALGFVLYFLLREPVLLSCKQCGTETRREFAYCPSCGATLHRACPSCHQKVEPVWTHCANCGSELGPSAGAPTTTGTSANLEADADKMPPHDEGRDPEA